MAGPWNVQRHHQHPNSLKARYIIKQLRGLRYDHEVETEVGHFVLGGAAQRQEQASQGAVLSEMFSHNKIRVLLISCLVLQMAQLILPRRSVDGFLDYWQSIGSVQMW